MKISRGLRNNNPGNIRINADKFQGEVIPSQDTAFKQFQTMAYGYRAMFVILNTYLKQGVNTIETIIKRWAPENENDTQAYINFVSAQSGVSENFVLSNYNGKEYIKIVSAMSYMENGTASDDVEVIAGFSLQKNFI